MLYVVRYVFINVITLMCPAACLLKRAAYCLHSGA